jgi:hypothetical protein
MNETFRGITIDWSYEYENAYDSIRVKCEFDSNVIDESELHLEKQHDPRISTLFGIKINWNDESENVSDPIHVKCEFDSNVINESNSHPEKQCVVYRPFEVSIVVMKAADSIPAPSKHPMPPPRNRCSSLSPTERNAGVVVLPITSPWHHSLCGNMWGENDAKRNPDDTKTQGFSKQFHLLPISTMDKSHQPKSHPDLIFRVLRSSGEIERAFSFEVFQTQMIDVSRSTSEKSCMPGEDVLFDCRWDFEAISSLSRNPVLFSQWRDFWSSTVSLQIGYSLKSILAEFATRFTMLESARLFRFLLVRKHEKWRIMRYL